MFITNCKIKNQTVKTKVKNMQLQRQNKPLHIQLNAHRTMVAANEQLLYRVMNSNFSKLVSGTKEVAQCLSAMLNSY